MEHTENENKDAGAPSALNVGLDLLPCPFCGSTITMTRDSGSYGYRPPLVIAKCKTCDISFSEPTEEWAQGKGTYSIEQSAITKLFNRWNARANVQIEGQAASGLSRSNAGLCPTNQGERT